jgi:adenylosuccinate synthase
MTVVAVIGGQWGDEGKGKIVDMLSEKAKYVVRFSGGDNAGHTVVNPFGEFKLRLTPSGIFCPGATAIIGNGVVLNPRILIEELDDLKSRGVDTSRLFISDRAHLIMPYHIVMEGLEEAARGGRAIGTTGKGIGPAYADKVARNGIRAGDLLDRQAFLERLTMVVNLKNRIITRVFGGEPLPVEDIYKQYCRYAERLAPMICDTTVMLGAALERNEPILLEGAQGVLLDPDFGTYPYATSSSPLAANACLGAGVGPGQLSCVVGVYKAFQTRVGAGPMPTELKDEIGDSIREMGQEYGTVTRRPRRCGWFDAVAARLSRQVNDFNMVAITRLDVLDRLPYLKICTAYTVDGQVIRDFPASIATLEKCQPVYEELPGWEKPTGRARTFRDLPLNARRYVKRLEELIGCPAGLIGIGKSREQTIVRKACF